MQNKRKHAIVIDGKPHGIVWGKALIVKQWNDGPLLDILYNYLKTSNIECLVLHCPEEFKIDFNASHPIKNLTGNNTTLFEYEKLFIEKDIKVHIIFGSKGPGKDPSPHFVRNVTYHYWETYWFYALFFYGEDKTLLVDEIKSTPQPNKIGSLMINRGHYHRCRLMDRLSFHNLLGKIYFSWHSHKLKTKIFDHWEDYEKVFKFDDDFHNTRHTTKNIPSEFYKGAVHIVSESSDLVNFWTEKTALPIWFEIPFIIQGGYRANLDLQLYGFELYDEIFDYSFDNLIQEEFRLNGVISNILNLVNTFKTEKDFKYLREITREKTIHNRNVARNIVEQKMYIPQIYYDIAAKYGNSRPIDEVFSFKLIRTGI